MSFGVSGMKHHKTSVLFVLGLSLVGLVSCALPVPEPMHPGREGLLDYLSHLEPGRKGRREFRPKTVNWKAELDAVGDKDWLWPLKKIEVTSPFGNRGRRIHDGLDLKASEGTPVYAAQEGVVVHSGATIRGYGKMIVLKHPNSGLFTVYAHNSRNLVRVGSTIKKGQQIAYSGSTGRVSGPHLHFEIRDGMLAVDPLEILPKPQ